MIPGQECICCKEIPQVASKNSTPSTCIIEHPGFHAVCLNVWVLQVAYYYQYRQQHGLLASPMNDNAHYVMLS